MLREQEPAVVFQRQAVFPVAFDGGNRREPVFSGRDFPPCLFCRHLRNAGRPDGEGWTCRAYPWRIPYSFLSRQEDHTIPRPFEDGLHYEPMLFVDMNGRHYTVEWDGAQRFVSFDAE